jgi:hypothetical protein
LPIATQPTSQAVQTTPEQLRDSIKAITAKSLTLQDPVQRVAVIDGPLFSISQGAFSEIIAIYRDLAETARAASLQLRNLPRFESSPDVATMVKEIYDYYHSVSLSALVYASASCNASETVNGTWLIHCSSPFSKARSWGR